jgi:hypothetical protein
MQFFYFYEKMFCYYKYYLEDYMDVLVLFSASKQMPHIYIYII